MLHFILQCQLDVLIFLLMNAAVALGVDIRFLRRSPNRFRRLRTWASVLILAAVGAGGAYLSGEYQRERMRLSIEGFAPTYAYEMMQQGHSQIGLQTAADDPLYLHLIDRQKRWLNSNPAVADIYTMRLTSDHQIAILVDSETDYDGDGHYDNDAERRTPIGEIYPQLNALIRQAFEGDMVFDDVPYTDRWGSWVSAYTPLYDSSGNVEGILGVDFPAADWIRIILLTRIGVLGLSLAVIVGLMVQTRDSIVLQSEVDRHREVALQLKTQSIAAQQALRRLQSYEYALDSHAILLVTDKAGTITHTNQLFCNLSGFTREELLGQNHRVISSGQHPRTFWDGIWRTIAVGGIWNGEICNRAKDGSLFWIDNTIVPFKDDSDTVTTYISIGTDVTARKRYEHELMTAARLDKLTGLPNRSLLLDRLQQAINRSRRISNYGFAVMFMDYDRFKLINDSLGHDVGDMLLKEIASRLREHLRSCDSISLDASGTTVARLGGDEFVVLVEGIQRPVDAVIVAERLLQACDAPYQLGEHMIRSTASIGIVCSDPRYQSADEMLRDADTAMYQAKARGKARYVIFDSSMQQSVRDRLLIENDLRDALGTDQFFLEYQPIVSLEDGSLRGAEALARWNHPTRGVISPGQFIAIAEEIHLVMPLTLRFLEQACTQFVAWQHQFPERTPDCISVNLSRIQLTEPDLVEQIMQIVQDSGISPDRLQLEITETEIMQDRETALRVLDSLKAHGVKLAMDDFGTGHSSLACLHELPFDVLKIDRAFVANLSHGRAYILLANSIVTLAENLGMKCVAEGIENLDQIALLQSMGCSCGQGYYLGRPVSASAFITGEWNYTEIPDGISMSEATV